jgi:hypothetical protein
MSSTISGGISIGAFSSSNLARNSASLKTGLSCPSSTPSSSTLASKTLSLR